MNPIRGFAVTAAVVVAIPLAGTVVAARAQVDPCAGWMVVELASGLGMVENLLPDGRGGMLLSASDRDQIERLLPDGTVEVAFEDVPAPGGMRIVDGHLFVNTGDSATSGALGTADGTIQRISLDDGSRETWASGIVMPNGLAIAPDGTAFTSRDIGVDGAITMVPPGEPREPVRWAEIRDSNGLAVDRAGEWLYVSTTFDPLAPVNRVSLADPTRIELVANLTTVGIPVAKGLDDLTMDAADVLYLTANGSGEVLRLDPATGDACVLGSGVGNPTAVKLGAGPGWASDHLFVSAWDGIIRELVPPVGAEPTAFEDEVAPPTPDPGPGSEPDVGPVPAAEPDPDTDQTPALPATGGGPLAVVFAMGSLGLRSRLRQR